MDNPEHLKPNTQHQKPNTQHLRATYGLDAPNVVAILAACAVVLPLLSIIPLPRPIVGTLRATGILCGVEAILMVYSSYVGKFRERDRLLDSLALTGKETVLDMGCGRGLLLLGAAKRLPEGKAVGIDLWQTTDQSGNAADATQENARAEGVEDRIEIHTGDMRTLPFADNTFDAVVSSLAIHNIPDQAGREQAVQEAFRVLKPGGRAALLDFRNTADYAATLKAGGAEQVNLSGLRFAMFPPVRIVSARKPHN